MWDERYAAKELVWSAKPNELFAREVADLPPGRALDVACGEGRNAIWLAEQGWDVTALDFSEVGIDKARRIAERRDVQVRWLTEDVTRFVPAADGYDLVSVLFLHTASGERGQWLHKVTAAVKPGGTFIYIGHDPSNIEHGAGGPQDPLLLPGATELCEALTDFRIEFAGVVERVVGGETGHGASAEGVALDTLVRAVRRVLTS